MTPFWAPLDDNQLSIAAAPDATLIATFDLLNYGGFPHAMFKCGADLFCDANWCHGCDTNPDNIVRKHTLPADKVISDGFHVVAIPE